MSERTGLEVAVVGLAGRFPGAKDVAELWRNLAGGVESIIRFTDGELAAAGVPPEVLADPRHVGAGAMIEDPDLLDAEFFQLTPREAEVIDPQHRLFLECAWEAMESAGYEPESCGRTVGVYAGVSLSTYALLNVWSHRGLLESAGGLLGADKDHLTTLVSWKLNLGGPSLAVQTACSTSLVAVHLAVQALLNGECDMALAGGAAIRFPQRTGYLWSDGGIVSPDGRCRAFDAEARGTVFGDGVGIVVLKRLEDAVAARDTIHAVIKGSAINNDGSGRIGYTAPSPEGQARVIRAAQLMAEVDPGTIGYVEAHGTGTALGDPIEVSALTEAFRAGTDRTGFCALGSVKTNLGHLNSAAGVTGLIKAVLALEHRTIPPTLHFQQPNPRLDLASSPFFVNTELLDWKGGEEPRRAAVSSFGMGGTNAHVILEEAPEPDPSTPSRPVQMLVLSARSAAALEAATDRLAAHVESHPDADLADVAHTLHVGRRGFGHRRIVLAATRQEAAGALAERDPRRVLTAAGGDREQPLVFLFPGQGSQYVDMARGLYQAEPVFRREVDRSADLLRPGLGFDLREALFPEPEQAVAAAERLARTAVTQPALFVVEHALARLWMEWGLRPQGMIGHSIGEYVAACLAGVFTLEEALDLVILRGRLIEELPGGAMLAVPLGRETLEPLLAPGLALAAVNGPALSVVAGSRDDVERLRRQVEPLLPEGLECRPLHTSHAFHSAAMEPVLARFTEGVRQTALQPPTLPFVSNVTGRWITAAEATDPAYWARHLRQTVRFAEGLQTLAESIPDGLLLEVGPGRTLSTLARQHPALAGRTVLSSLRPPRDAAPDQEGLLRTLGQIWLAGVPVDWPAFYAAEHRRRIPLPTYPFERRRYWIEPRREAGGVVAIPAASEAEQKAVGSAALEPAVGVLAQHPRPGLATAYVAPRTEIEQAIAGVWRDLFGIAEIGVHDDFFELGGHSLLVTRMASRLREALGMELPLQALFEERTVAGLAALVEREQDGAHQETPAHVPSEQPLPFGPLSARRLELLRAQRREQGLSARLERIPRRPDVAEPPLSFGQQRLWLLDQLVPGNPFYILSGALQLTGALDARALEAAFAELVRRHETLRTGFAGVDGRPVQRIEPALGFELPLADLSGGPARERQSEVLRLATAHARRPFDLGRPPLVRAALLRLAETEHVLLYALHHIVSDGWSTGVLVGEVAKLYAAFARAEPSPLPELPVQYADFAAWQRGWLAGEALERQLGYWRERLSGAPVSELPADRPRPPVQSFRGTTWRTALPPELAAWLGTLAREQGVSLFMALLAGFDSLVSRYTGVEDVVVGTPIAGRTRAELEGLIGFFVNTLVLRTDLSGDPTAAEAMARVRETAIGAYAHQDLPFEHLVEKLQPRRDLSRNPLFQLMLNLLRMPEERVQAGELSLARLELQGATAPFDLQVYLIESDVGVATVWEYSTDLFDAATVQRLARHFAALLEGMAAAPGARLSELSLLNEPERRQLLEWNATGREVPGGCIHEWVAAQAVRTPEAVAVVFGAESLTYGELGRRTGGLAERLRALGAGPEVRVGVALERSLEMVVGLLAVLEAGGAYVPLDPAFPAERLAFMLQDSGVAAVLTQESVQPRLPDAGGVRVLLGPGARHDTQTARAPRRGPAPEQAAYVIYTSGSTGWPKGVQIPHGALANFLAAMAERPGLGAHDALLAVTSLSFDIAGLEIFLPLMVGGRVVVASREEAGDGRLLQERIADGGVTVLQATPATWRLLLESGWQGGERLKALCGGEALPPALAASLLQRVGSLWNVYGPTETTVWSTLEEIRSAEAVVIGRPVFNTEAYVLDGRGQPVPAGAAGELYLGGAGLARGYLGRPELTAERFVPDPFGAPGSRLYRTGDLARHRADGRLECLGRIDHQVKVRGFRIELGEIEAALGRHPNVAAAVVVAQEDAAGDRRLVAYVVPRGAGVDLAGELRAWVRQSLPESMVPSAWVQLERLPLTPNGKVDRKALPAPAAGKPSAVIAPRTLTEQVLASIWARVLGVEAVGVEDSFFDLGGHSLLATQVMSRVREAFAVELPLRRIFENPTVAGLARVIEADAGGGPEAPPLTRTPRDGAPALSFGQQRLWFLNRLEPESPAYNIPLAVRLLGRLDRENLARAFGEIVRRHEALRTTFQAAGSEPVQEIDPVVPVRPFHLATVDLGCLPAGQEWQARRLAAEEAGRPFALDRGPLLRAVLLRLAPEEHVLLLTMHHIVSDGWSMGVLVRELTALYRAFGSGQPSPLPELPIQYADFAAWQRAWLSGPVLAERLGYWKERLANAPALLELPADRPRPAVQRFRGGRRRVSLDAEPIRRLRALCQERGATLFMGLLAAFSGLLRRSTGQEDIVIGSPIAGRQRVETEDLIGLFLNTLVLRTDLPGDPAFQELLDRAREVALQAYAHQDLPFEKLVDELDLRRDLSHTPLLQVLLVLQNAPLERVDLPGLTLLPLGGVEGSTAKFDLAVNLTEIELTGGVAGLWIYNTDLFDPATMIRMSGHFERLLEGIAAAPERRLSDLPLLSGPERQQLLEWNATAAADPGERCLHQWIEAQAARTPEAVAVVDAGNALTYAELDARSERLAGVLRALGVGPEVRVGICVERSLEMMVGLLGILKAGGAYVPLDPSYPAERLAFMLEDSRQESSVLLTQRRLLGVLPAQPGQVICLDEPLPLLPPQPGNLPVEREVVQPDHLAYMIYTSGSTGRPKGAMNSHRAIVNRLLWMQDSFGLTPDDRVIQKTPFSFDVSVWELFWPLLTGARLVIARPGGHQDAGYLARLIAEQEVTTVHFVPSMLQVFLDAPELPGCSSLQRVIASGEALPADFVRRFFDRLGWTGAGLHNLYGPTEAAVDVTSWACERQGRRSSVPIGRPIANTRIHLLDRRGSPVPIGVPGELHIGGVQVGRGYLGRPALTAEKFVPDFLGGQLGARESNWNGGLGARESDWNGGLGARLYRTGDLARYLPDGAIEFLGRIDHQVKIRGFRIELEEIAAALATHPTVREAVVIAREGAAGAGMGDWRLVAYVVPEAGNQIEPSGLRTFLAGSLPEYMLPVHWVVLDGLPLTPSGKVDRRALPQEAGPAEASGEHVAPRNELERFLAALWKDFLGVDAGVRDDFFALGGNSITGAVLINRLQERLGEIVHVVVLFDAPTVEKMAAHLAREHAATVERLFGPGAVAGASRQVGANPGERVGAAEAARFRDLLVSPPAQPLTAVKNRPAVFVLSPPRSGSTLLRVMLGGHPRLFAPPELELLGFGTLAERRAAFPGRDSFWLEGAIRAVMEVRGCGAEEARALMEELEAAGLTTAELYGRLQEWLGERILVDKTPSYALDPQVLRRAEEVFDEPFYIHLIRHPYGMIHSFEEAKLDQLFFRREHPFSRRQLAELVWLVSHENVVRFLSDIPSERQLWVRFEDLVADPEATLRGLCDALDIEYHPDMAEPYQEKSARMTDGLHAESRMLGDVKFHQHSGIDREAAVRWRERYRDDSLGDLTWDMAGRLGYLREPAQPRPEAPPLVRAAREATLPLSFAQQRLWFLDRLEPGSPAYNISAALRLEGRLNMGALAATLDEVVRRHEVLRTTFAEEGEEPVQRIHPPRPADLRVADLAGIPAAERIARATELARAGLRQPFELDRGPLLRALLLRLGEHDHVLLFSIHHIVSDGWSMGVLVREVGALYRAAVLEQPASLPDLPIQYADYAVWQRNWLRGETLAEHVAYWRERLAGAPALLGLPTDRPRPAVQRFQGERADVRLPSEPSAALRALAQRRGATPFMALLAVFAALLRRHSGEDDIVIGTPVANRDRAELEGLIGLFVNSLPLRVEMSGAPSFEDLLGRVRATAVGAYAHQGLPFEKVVVELQPQRDLSSSPVFQVMLTLQNVPAQALDLPGLELRPFAAEIGAAKLDLTLDLFETPVGFAGSLEYNTDLFDRSTVDRLKGHFRNLVAAAAAAPATSISDLPLLAPAERHQLAVEWSDTAAEYPAGGGLHELIARQAARTPEAVAVTFEDEILTYGELEARAGRLARFLADSGVRRESLVGLCMERSLALPAVLLGILAAGAAYVPMDPDYPEERLAYMLEDAGLSLLLVGPGAPEGLCRRAAGRLSVIRYGEIGPEAERGLGDPLALPTPADPGALAYVLYTSGSTGRPKGVEIPHGALVNFLASMSEQPGLGQHDVLLAVTSLSFDIAGLELYLPLLAGARVDLASREAAADGGRLLARLRDSGATVLQATPATWRMLIDAGWEGEPEVRALCGGEALPERLAAELRARSGSVWNLYGPTETTIWSAASRVVEGGVTVGRPIANTRIVLLDAGLRPVPVGAPGELWIGGEGLARGYRNRPDLTAERFAPDPFSAEPGARSYRTGDLARFRPDGAIEVLGRLDHQVKVRGYRIELGEIEAALEGHPEVARAVALAVEDRLLSWLVPQGASRPTPAELRAQAAKTLPDFMIPAGFVWLAELPLTPNGKVDRRALPGVEAPRTEAAAGPAAEPRNQVEDLLAGMWCELLGTERVGIHDDFFDLGGHSLKATQLAARVRQAFGVDLPLRRLFERPTVAGLAEVVERLRRDGRHGHDGHDGHDGQGRGAGQAPALVPVSRTGELPLSFSQQRVWILEQLEAAGTAYHLGTAVRLRGDLDTRSLEWALNEVVGRHEALRTTFASSHGRPLQLILPRRDVPLPRVDLRSLPAELRESEARRVAGGLARQRFDLARGPLLRAVLVSHGQGDHLLGLTVHHIAADGWSLGILVREAAVLYQAHREGSPSPLPPLPIQYVDFAAWQRSWLQGEALEAQLSYWRGQLAGLPPVLQLALDRTRRPGRAAPAGRRRAHLSQKLAEALRQLGRREHATPFMTLLSGFATVLHRATGQRDLAVGTPIANRGRVELENLIGFFANTLVLRADLEGDPGFQDLLGRVRTLSLDAYTHQDLPFERLVEELQPDRDLAVNPLFQVMFQMQNVPLSAVDLPGLSLVSIEAERGAAMFDLVLAVLESGPGFAAYFEYDADLFEPATVERLAGHWVNLLAGATADPGRPLSALPLLAAAEVHQVSVEWSDSVALRPEGVCVHQLIERQAERVPDATAVSFEGLAVTYRELDARAGRLAVRLASLGIGPETRVGVCLQRSPAMVAALLAVWKTGAAYVPMDPFYPVERLSGMLDDSGIALLLTDGGTPADLVERAAAVVRVDQEILPEERARALAAPGNPAQLAYVIYTSGSTGRPKGVEITHGALVNFLHSMAEQPGLGPEDVLLAVTSLSFDIAALELFLPLLAGGRVELASREVAADGSQLLRLLQESGATVMQATPVTWSALVGAGWQGGEGLAVFCGGEALPERLAADLCARSHALWNLYGPTETTVWSAARRLRSGARVAVGPPIANTGLYLLDAGLRPVPVGVPGELWIGEFAVGAGGLARGYRNRPDLTAERFVPNPFAAGPGARLYRTGDLARSRPDSAIELLGRLDHQVKVRGFRIELEEIEAALEAHPAVERGVVTTHGEEGDKRLVAYLVPRGGDAAALSVTDLRESLARSLPDYMVPSAWVVLDALPLTPNGKVDRRALPAPGGGRPARGGAYVAPRTALEEVVAGIWAEVLSVVRVGVEDNFFALGGHSLLATRVLSRLGETLEIEVPLRRLFEAPTVAGLAGAMPRYATSGEDLETAARLVLDLLHFSDDEVESLLLQQANRAEAARETP